MEGFAVLSSKMDQSETLDFISNVANERYGQHTNAHHEWIHTIEPGAYKDALESIRTSHILTDAILKQFPNTDIQSVPEVDEVYWSASPKSAKGSDRSLVDCHYDAPFSLLPTGDVVFYRIILAVNHNNTVTTIFPDEHKSVLMDKGDFHGLDYNKDWHCVEGSIPPDKFRVLLKLHYIVSPKKVSNFWIQFVYWLNVLWTYFSRYTMRISGNPETMFEYLIGGLVNVARFTYNNGYRAMFAGLYLCFIACFMYVGLKRFFR